MRHKVYPVKPTIAVVDRERSYSSLASVPQRPCVPARSLKEA
jgi:hypothetical protein